MSWFEKLDTTLKFVMRTAPLNGFHSRLMAVVVRQEAALGVIYCY